jgi:hypothetical protein
VEIVGGKQFEDMLGNMFTRSPSEPIPGCSAHTLILIKQGSRNRMITAQVYPGNKNETLFQK